jgi:hypothetical protein
VKDGPLKTATAIVGLLAGVAAAVYVLGGLVISLRLLFDHFSVQGAVTVVGQLPRESVITMALLNVIGPAAALGLLAAIVYGLLGRPRGREGDDDLRAGRKRHVAGLFLFFALVAILGALPALDEAFKAEDVSPLLLPGIYAVVVTFGITAAGWFWLRRVGGNESWSRIGKALVAGGVWTVIALVPMLMLAGAKPFEQAQVCTTTDLQPTKGRLIGESSTRVFIEEEFGEEAAVLMLPADQVTKSETGDLSSTFVCPLPPGQKAAGKAAEARLGGHGSPAEVELATALRPRLRFDSGEPWRPIAVDQFVAERFPGGATELACWFAPRKHCEPLTGLGELRRGPQAPAYIEIDGEGRNGVDYHSPRRLCRQGLVEDCNEGRPAVIYYRRTSHEGRWYWDYWWFYRYNDYVGRVNDCTFYCADHEGDWEGITVITTPSLTPEVIGAIYAAHKDRVYVEGNMLPRSSGHPLAFVAEGTHATYPYRCARADCEQFGTIAGARLPEDRFDGEVSWGGNDDAQCLAYRCVRPLPEVGEPDDTAVPLAGEWAAWPGKWGSSCVKGCDDAESSPNSPGLQIRFKCPWAPTRWARLSPDGTVSKSEPAGDAERLRALCEAQRGGE